MIITLARLCGLSMDQFLKFLGGKKCLCPQTGSSLGPSRTEQKFIKSTGLLPSSSLLVRPACMHDGHFIPCCGSLCKNNTHTHTQTSFARALLSNLRPVQRVSDSIPPSSPSCGSDWVQANAEGQAESCSWGCSAGVSPVSLPQRSLVDAAWQGSAEALQVPLPNHDTRCRSSRALQLPMPVYPLHWNHAAWVRDLMYYWCTLSFCVSPCSLKKRSFPRHSVVRLLSTFPASRVSYWRQT